MVTSNKDAARIWAEIEKARNITPKEERKEERGANDLERRIDDLMAINKRHQQQNGELMKENLFYKKKAKHYQVMSDQLKKELEQFKQKATGVLTEFRNKGDV